MLVITIRDIENKKWKGNAKQNKTKNKEKHKVWGGSYSESVRAEWFHCAFKLGFLQLMCTASLILSRI